MAIPVIGFRSHSCDARIGEKPPSWETFRICISSAKDTEGIGTISSPPIIGTWRLRPVGESYLKGYVWAVERVGLETRSIYRKFSFFHTVRCMRILASSLPLPCRQTLHSLGPQHPNFTHSIDPSLPDIFYEIQLLHFSSPLDCAPANGSSVYRLSS